MIILHLNIKNKKFNIDKIYSVIFMFLILKLLLMITIFLKYMLVDFVLYNNSIVISNLKKMLLKIFNILKVLMLLNNLLLTSIRTVKNLKQKLMDKKLKLNKKFYCMLTILQSLIHMLYYKNKEFNLIKS